MRPNRREGIADWKSEIPVGADGTNKCEEVRSVADNFDEDTFAAEAVEFAVEDLFPRTEVEFPVGDGDDDFATHDGAFEVGVGVVLGPVVGVLGPGFLGGEFFQPAFEVLMEAGLVIVDEHAGADVHGVAEQEAIGDRAVTEAADDVGSDVDESASGGDIEPEFLAVAFHGYQNSGCDKKSGWENSTR